MAADTTEQYPNPPIGSWFTLSRRKDGNWYGRLVVKGEGGGEFSFVDDDSFMVVDRLVLLYGQNVGNKVAEELLEGA